MYITFKDCVILSCLVAFAELSVVFTKFSPDSEKDTAVTYS